jgi:predicted mannosyl-3-phosphoglycerate phosphatase (HAD superfamily)
MQSELVRVLMERDGLTSKEVEYWLEDVKDQMYEIIETESMEEAEQYFIDELGLEPDFISDLILSI